MIALRCADEIVNDVFGQPLLVDDIAFDYIQELGGGPFSALCRCRRAIPLL
jgi:hypothetical protein